MSSIGAISILRGSTGSRSRRHSSSRARKNAAESVNVLDDIAMEAGAFYVFDRGYLDFARLYRFTLSAAFFVTRTKECRREREPVEHTSELQSPCNLVC